LNIADAEERLNRYVEAQQRTVAVIARLVPTLAPADSMLVRARLLRAQRLIDAGRTAEAQALADDLHRLGPATLGQSAEFPAMLALIDAQLAQQRQQLDLAREEARRSLAAFAAADGRNAAQTQRARHYLEQLATPDAGPDPGRSLGWT
jgi:hypothetical protein